jgi:hypothetical protein
MSVPIATADRFSAGAPHVAFEGDFVNVGGISYDVAPNGKRFLVLQPPEPSTTTSLQVVLNWFEELKRRVPMK